MLNLRYLLLTIASVFIHRYCSIAGPSRTPRRRVQHPRRSPTTVNDATGFLPSHKTNPRPSSRTPILLPRCPLPHGIHRRAIPVSATQPGRAGPPIVRTDEVAAASPQFPSRLRLLTGRCRAASPDSVSTPPPLKPAEFPCVSACTC
jgi:hypothetical protein